MKQRVSMEMVSVSGLCSKHLLDLRDLFIMSNEEQLRFIAFSAIAELERRTIKWRIG